MIISRLQQNSLFRRDVNIFDWARSKPWVTDGDIAPLNYHFSYRAGKFENILYEYRHAESGARGFLWLIHHNRALSVPYLFAEEDQLIDAMAVTLTRAMIDLGGYSYHHPALRIKRAPEGLQKDLPFFQANAATHLCQ